jgi:hypothetical protein
VPERIQVRPRQPFPANTVFIGPGSLFQNPYDDPATSRAKAYDGYLLGVRAGYDHIPDRDHIVTELDGKDVACVCGPDDLCHGDALLDIAAGADPGRLAAPAELAA